MIPPPQVIPNNIKPIKDSNIKTKTFSTIGIGGEFDVKKTPLSPPGTKVVIHEKSGQQNIGTHMGYRGSIWDHLWNTTYDIQ